MKAETILAGCGVGILFTFQYLAPPLSPDHLILYHSRLPVGSVAWGLLIDLAVVSLLAALIIYFLEKSRSRRLNPGWAVAGAALAWRLADISAAITGHPIPHRDLVRIVGLTIALALALRWFWPLFYQKYSRGVLTIFLLAGFSTVWVVPELLHLAFSKPVPAPLIPVHSTPASLTSPVSGGRIVWLLFDELSYDQTFGHRAAGLSMPSFDEFRKSSILFEDLRPTGYYTELVVPSLFLGDVVDGLKSNVSGKPLLKIVGQDGWRGFDARATVFSAAEGVGWTTGVVGWYNPYCRILAGTLNFCYARLDDREISGMTPDASTLENTVAPVEIKIRSLEHKPELFEEQHEADYRALMQQAKLLLRDEKIRFVFIHLPIPHPPGIYDRKTGQLRSHGSYLDNLALADRSLGELMAVLHATPSAAKTTVIVCSDHSWRLHEWRPWPTWTKEEETASRDKFDPRPMLMIHFPSQTAAIRVTRPFDEIRLHQVLLRMLHGEMDSPAKFADWMDRAPGAQPATTANLSK